MSRKKSCLCRGGELLQRTCFVEEKLWRESVHVAEDNLYTELVRDAKQIIVLRTCLCRGSELLKRTSVSRKRRPHRGSNDLIDLYALSP